MQGIIRLATTSLLTFLLTFFALGLVSQTATAGIVGTDTIVAEQNAHVERAKIASLLDREDVRERLVSYGVSPEDAQERVASMRDEEVLELAENIEALPAGGSRLLIIVLLVVIIALLL